MVLLNSETTLRSAGILPPTAGTWPLNVDACAHLIRTCRSRNLPASALRPDSSRCLNGSMQRVAAKSFARKALCCLQRPCGDEERTSASWQKSWARLRQVAPLNMTQRACPLLKRQGAHAHASARSNMVVERALMANAKADHHH